MRDIIALFISNTLVFHQQEVIKCRVSQFALIGWFVFATYHFNVFVNPVEVLQFSKADFEVCISDFFRPHTSGIMNVLQGIRVDNSRKDQRCGVELENRSMVSKLSKQGYLNVYKETYLIIKSLPSYELPHILCLSSKNLCSPLWLDQYCYRLQRV